MARKQNRQRKLERKAAKGRKRTRRQATKPSLSLSAARGLAEAEELMDRGKYVEAVEVLEELALRYPREVEILSCLAEAYLQTGDRWSYQRICERLTVADPKQPLLWLALGTAALTNAQPAAAYRAFAHMAAEWPEHVEAAEARRMQESLREFLANECRRCKLDEEIGVRVLLLHDEVNLHLHRGKFDKACDAASRLLAICPVFAPALNNRGEAHFRAARFPEAIADSRRVLQFDATNVHALANLTRYLYLSGQFEEAQATANALRTCDADDGDEFLKKAETFAILGDWEAVRKAVSDGQSEWAKTGGVPALAEHLVGVALANLGDLKAARQHWRRAAAAPDLREWAEENLNDSQRPPDQRHGPWAFPLECWVSRGVLERISEIKVGVRQGELAKIIQRHFKRYPQLELLSDAILQGSDRSACEMLTRLAPLVDSPAIFAALKKFALGDRGSDDLRLRTLMMLSQEKQISGEVQIWREGALHPIRLVSQEIHCEPNVDLPPEVNDLMVSAYEAINEGRGAEAERLLDKGLRLRPDNSSMQFNRAVAIRLQGREDEALEIIRQIHRDDPDYVFARTHLADVCIAEGHHEEAETLLVPISQMRRLHTSEYAAWCSANINLALAKGEPKVARTLLSTWEQISPGDERIKIWKGRLRGGRGLLGRLNRLLEGWSDDEK